MVLGLDDADLEDIQGDILPYLPEPCTVDGTPAYCKVRDAGSYTPRNMPSWVQVPRKILTFPVGTPVHNGSTVVTATKGTFYIQTVTTPQSFELTIRSTATPLGDAGALAMTNYTVRFSDDAHLLDPSWTLTADVLIFPVSQIPQPGPESVLYRYCVVMPAGLTYDDEDTTVGPHDSIYDFPETPRGAALSTPYPSMDPTWPVRIAYFDQVD